MPISYLAIIAIIGYAAERTRFVPDISSGLSRVIVNITLPVTIIMSISDQDVGGISFFDIVVVAGIAFAAIFSLLLVQYFFAKLFKVDQTRRLLHSYLGSFGNVVFLGYPFINQLFGTQGLFYAIVYSIVNELILWSVGAYFLNKRSQEPGNWSLKRMLNPNTLSFCIGISMLLLGFRFPGIIHAPLLRLSQATVPLSMLFIGSMLAQTKLQAAIKDSARWFMCFIKMLFAPLSIIALACFFGIASEQANSVLLIVAILQVAMPSQTILAVLADRYDADAPYAVQTIFLSTLLSLLTLPFIYFVAVYFLA